MFSLTDRKRGRPSLAAFVTTTAVAACSLGVAALVADDPASAAFPGTGGVIVFASNQPAPATAPAEEQSVDFEIYSMQADGTQLTQLTDNSIVPPSEEGDSTEGGAPNDQGGPPPGKGEGETTDGGLPVLINDLDPAVSPDGKTIAFTSNRPAADGSTDNEIYLMDLDGTDVRQVTDQKSGPPQGNAEHELAWAPDGNRLVFRRGDGVKADLYILDLTTKQEQKLNTPPSTGQIGPEGSPAWSPDGKTIAFTKGKGPAAGVWTYDVASGLLNELANQGEVSEGYPNWSPDGRHVLFTRGDDSAGSAIWQIEVATGVQKQLSNLPVEGAMLLYSDSHPAFSWDGTKIAFQSTRDGNMKGAEGETTEGGVPAEPTISERAADEGHGGGKPEVEFDTGNVEIYVMNADGTGQTRLTNNGGVDDPATELVDESKAGPKDQMPDWSGTPLPKPVIPPVTPPADTPAQTVASVGAASINPATKVCASRRTFRIRISKQIRTRAVRKATVYVNGKKVTVRTGTRITAPVTLTGLPKGKAKVKIVLQLKKPMTIVKNGKKVRVRQMTSTRTYQTCAAKLPASNDIGKPGRL